MSLRSVETTTLDLEVLERIRHAIVHGDIPPGRRINHLRTASHLGVSRGPLREAIRRLNPAIAEEPRDGLQARIGIAEPGDADRARILQMLGLPGLSAFVPSVRFVGPSALLR